jgi:AcrR family transcriptional regulator
MQLYCGVVLISLDHTGHMSESYNASSLFTSIQIHDNVYTMEIRGVFCKDNEEGVISMKTREIIIEAAFRLFVERPFPEITVQDILDEAGVSRKTFYKYFRDKYELQEIYYLEQSSNVFDRHHLPEHMDDDTWRELSTGVLQFMKDHRQFYRNAGREKKVQDSLWSFLRQTLIDLYTEIRRRNTKQDTLSPDDQITVQCIVEAIMKLFEIYTFETPALSMDALLDVAMTIIPVGYRFY